MKIDKENLMEDNKINVKKPKEHKNNTIMWITIAIIVITFFICIIMIIMQGIKPIDESIKVYINGQETQMDSSVYLIEDNKIYFNVKGIASFVGYEAHSGEYKIEAEDVNKVFVENKQETASMFLNSTTISKIEPGINDEYKNYTMSEPAREVNGELYVISDGIENACNIKVKYDLSKRNINIQTLSYIYDLYNQAVQNRGYKEISDNFENQKALLYDRIIVQNADGRYGVIDSNAEEVISTRYSYIQFDEYNKEFTITNAYNKVGIDYINGETKINVNYDEIKSIYKDKELYLVKSNDKYGVIDSKEKIIIHIEYDDIGVDLSPYIIQSNVKGNRIDKDKNDKNEDSAIKKDIVKQYVFFNSLIAVKQNNMWGFFDLSGNKLSDIKYTNIGCKAKTNEKTDNNSNQITMPTSTKTTANLLLIDEYELIIVEQNERYGLVNTSAQEIFRPEAEDIYSITNAGVKSYYMLFNGTTYDLENNIFKLLGLSKKTEE